MMSDFFSEVAGQCAPTRPSLLTRQAVLPVESIRGVTSAPTHRTGAAECTCLLDTLRPKSYASSKT